MLFDESNCRSSFSKDPAYSTKLVAAFLKSTVLLCTVEEYLRRSKLSYLPGGGSYRATVDHLYQQHACSTGKMLVKEVQKCLDSKDDAYMKP